MKTSKKKKNKTKTSALLDNDIEVGKNTNNTDNIERVILNNIDGYAQPKELLAIMGPSGCGKTSLLNIIAQRQLPTGKQHVITREVKANNIIMDQSNFGKICAYIMQEDILMDCLTPRESLTFGAKLKLKDVSDENIKRRVEKLLIQVILKYLYISSVWKNALILLLVVILLKVFPAENVKEHL